LDRIGGIMKGIKKIKERLSFGFLKNFIVPLISFIFIFLSYAISSDREDLRVIKRVVKAEDFSISSKSLKEAKWLNISIIEKNKMDREDVKIRICIPFLETILKSSKKCRIKKGEREIDFKDIIEELKRIGSMEVFLIEDAQSIVKIWLE